MPSLMTSIADQVREHGVCTVPASEFWGADEIATITNVGEAFLDEALQNPKAYTSGIKPFLMRSPRNSITGLHPIVKMQKPFKALAQEIVGEPVRCYAQEYWAVRKVDGAPVWSQNWHRDHEADAIIKFFLNLRDVGPNNGPFEFVRGSHGKRDEALCPFAVRTPTKMLGAYVEPGTEIPTDRIESFTCPAGTVVVADTTGIHRGGRLTEGHRLQAIWGFVPMSAQWRL